MVIEHNGFVYTTALDKIRGMGSRVRVVPGGTSAGKTYSIIPALINDAIETPFLEISIVSESVPHLRKGAIKDFLKIMRTTGRYIDSNWNRTFLTYTFSNGSYIEFFSADQEERVRGPRRNILYINECNNLSFDVYHQLAIRTSMYIYLDFNPSHEFWVYKELRNDADVEWLTLTYKDNEALPETLVREIEKAREKAYYDPLGNIRDEANIKSRYWSNWWRVYGLGELGSLEGVIFSNWSTISGVPDGAIYLGSGLDFGYTNHQSALVDIYEWGNKRVVDLVLYARGLGNDELVDAIKDRSGGFIRDVWADSAEPKTVDYIRGKGVSIRGVVKGPDSIVFGISVMQGQDYLITEGSTELIKEVRFYSYDTDKSGARVNQPAKGQQDHAIDAWRYHEMMTVGVGVRKQMRGNLSNALRNAFGSFR